MELIDTIILKNWATESHLDSCSTKDESRLPHDDIFWLIVKKPVEIPRGKLESRLRFDCADVGK